MSKPPPEPSVGGTGEDGFYAIVIGSGFGGSVAAYRLAEGGKKVCLLERGNEYPPGDFARGVAETKENFWSPRDCLFGLYDIWSFSRMSALVSAGLGGGSLIYANVLLRMPREWFDRWPISYSDLEPHYQAVEKKLSGGPYPQPLRETTPKTVAFRRGAKAAGLPVEFPNLAITFAPPGREGEEFDDGRNNRYDTPRYRCRLVGECDAGCNFGAKNTLDLTYLSQLDGLAGTVDVCTCCEAKSIARRPEGGYEVRYVVHPKGERRTVAAPRVIVAAGTFGSTRLLLRSQHELGGIRGPLGHRFSGNGDLLTFALGVRDVVDPARGPVITAAARVDDDTPRGRDIWLEDGGGPGAVWWLAELLETPRTSLRFLPRALRLLWKGFSGHPDRELGSYASAILGEARLAAHSLPLLGMGRDLPSGYFVLDGEDSLELRWGAGDRRDYYRRAHEISKRVSDSLGARLGDLAFRLNRYVTVHPLGGCSMGTSPENGVVDGFGRVFGHEDGLYVLDGSAMPGPVGANPSLTIAAFADRAALKMLGQTLGSAGQSP
jgi:cholesterol oxidase